ncbi:DALR anticodon-binding domain-containing protein, partial [Streptomyces sp. SL13]
GQSVGEFAASHIAGALDFDDASRLAAGHGRLLQQLAVGRGDGLGVPTGAAAVRHPAYATLGADAANWALVRPPAGDPPDLAPATHLPQRTANPLFRIRYAHARTRALTRNAADLGFAPGEFTPAAADEPAQAALLGAIGDYPRVVESAARHRAPDRVARALEGVADAFLDYHDSVALLPSGDGKPSAAHRSRLALADAAGTVLAGGLSLLGISAPAHL